MLRRIASAVLGRRSFCGPLTALDPVQRASMANERLILVDDIDQEVGSATKEECHLVSLGLPLHRAFSVLLFDDAGRLFLTKRASIKATFPNHWTNACCSHPLASTPVERDGASGVRLAAIRRLHHELGIPEGALNPEDLALVARFRYKSLGDGIWGEHELDYVLIAKGDVPMSLQPGEVQDSAWVSKKDLSSFIQSAGHHITPWFSLLVSSSRLNLWWDSLDKLDSVADPHTILDLTSK